MINSYILRKKLLILFLVNCKEKMDVGKLAGAERVMVGGWVGGLSPFDYLTQEL